MALNLSTLTSPATSGDVLAEALTTADFLEPCPVLKNLSRGSNKGGDAKQDVALNQPKALPLIDGDGYLYLSGVSGNFCEIPNDSSLAEIREVTVIFNAQTPANSTARYLFARPSASSFQNALVVEVSGGNRVSFYDQGGSRVVTTTITFGNVYTVKLTFNGTAVELFLDGVSVDTGTASSSNPFDISQNVLIGGGNTNRYLTGFVKSAVAKNASGTTVLNFDINATNVRHGDTKFKCATGQVVTINKAGNDPSTIIKKPVLRFANTGSTNISLRGLFADNIHGGYMFAAFSVLGNGGEAAARTFTINQDNYGDYQLGGAIFGYKPSVGNLRAYSGGIVKEHTGLFDDTNGDILQEAKITNGNQLSKVNNADLGTTSITYVVNSNRFNIAANESDSRSYGENSAIDLEFLALFSADSVPDEATASKIRDYINKRNNVFSLVDNSYYFFDPQKADFTGNFTDANTLDGYITGSDLGDTDVRSNLTLVQATQNDQPSTDGYTITFNDTAEHLEFENSASQNLSGWQVVGTSLGTFAYRVNNTAVTELNLLGNLGSAAFRQAGQSYGMILLPDSATGADIEAARKLLIDRGAADGTTASTVNVYFYGRGDIVEFKAISFSSATSLRYTWHQMSSLASFPSLDLTNAVDVNNAWSSCASLSLFGTTEITNCTDFTSAWQSCSALTSFSAGAKLGTAASSGVNFTNAWRSSGLTSFITPLRTGTSFTSAWQSCSNLESFNSDFTSATNVQNAFLNCSNLVDFASGTFDVIGTPGNSCFLNTWSGCAALSANSVENILVSINTSGKSAPSTNPQITIDYNTATGSLSAATNAAIDSLSGKGWEVFINGVLVIPNILDLQPAAAYSLRSFDASADPNVVNVRRSSDGATSDFTASQVSDGTLTDWVNTDVDLVTPTLNNGGFEDGSTGWTLSNGAIDTSEFYAGSKSVKLTVTGGAGAFVYKANLQVGSSYRVGFWAKISDASKQMRVEFGSAANKEDINFTSTDWEYKEVTKSATAVGLAFARQSTSGDYTINIDNITITQLTADGHVTTWYDQGGTNHATQTSGSAQPKIVDAGTLVTDGSGNPAIIGDGVDDTLVHPTLTNELDSSDFLVTAAYKDDLAMGIEGSIPRLYIQKGGFSYNTLGTVNYTDQTGRKVLSAQVSGNTQEVFSNGTSLGTATETQVDIGQNMFHVMQGGSAFSNGPLMEVVVFGDNQSANRTGIETNINDHFDIYS